MALSIQHKRGTFANKPALLEGEFYFADDTGDLYIGSSAAATGEDCVPIVNIPSGSSGAFASSTWKSEPNNQTAPPSTNKVKWNNTTQNTATELYVHDTDSSNTDVSVFLNLLAVGDRIRIQLQEDSTIFQMFEITSVSDDTTYFTFGINNLTSAGGNIANNKDILLTFITAANIPLTTTTYSETLTSGNWVLDTGTIYYQDVVHNLGTLDLIKAFRDTADDADFIVHSSVATDSNTLRVKIEGNTDNVRVVLSTGMAGTIQANEVPFTSLSTNTTLNTTTHRYIKVDTSSGDITLTLPLSVDALWSYDIWKSSSDINKVIVQRAGSDTISGDTDAFWNDQYANNEFFPDGGTEWLIK